MIDKEQGVILKKIKYSDSQNIVQVFCRNRGYQSFILSINKKGKNRSVNHLLQPLFIVNIEFYSKHGNAMGRIHNIEPDYVFQSIPFNAYKTTVGFFIADFLQHAVKFESNPSEIFEYLTTAIKYYDQLETGYYDFHLVFLIRISRFLGFLPERNSENLPYFDLMEGSFISHKPVHNLYFDEELCKSFSLALDNSAGFYKPLEISNQARRELLSGIMNYFRFHHQMFKNMESYHILNEVYNS